MAERQINEYRQPWESDEHWTLRKEFIERFQDDFPEDRLLCLAQVYSNVELLGCSYPAPVMLHIRELSKHLNECKELRGKRKERAAIQFVKEKQKAPPPRNSWNNSGSLLKKRKSSGSDLQANRDVPSGTSSKILKTSDSKLLSDGSSVCGSGSKDLSTAEPPSHSKCSTVCVDAAQGSSKNTAQSDSSSALSTSEVHSQTAMLPKCVKDNIAGILQFIRKSLSVQNTPLEILNNIGSKFSLKVDFNYKYFSDSTGPVHECSVEIDNVFLAKAKEPTKKKARSEAAKLVVDMLMGPLTKMEESSCSISSVPNTRIQAEEKCMGGTLSQNCAVNKTSTPGVKSSNSTPGKKSDTNGNNSLNNHNSRMCENACQRNLSNARIHHDPWSQRVAPDVYQNSGNMPNTWTTEPNPWLNNIAAKSGAWINNSFTEPDPWANNAKPVRPVRHQSRQDSDCSNPFPQFLVILDNSDITKLDNAASIFTHSANFNHVPFQFEYETLVTNSQSTTRGQIILNGQALCSAEGENKQAAKEAVAKVALSILRKTAHTIKVNDEHEGGFTVTRSQVFNTSESNNSLTESNIGCKMLKMMGWSGGGIGKTGRQGIEEPVKAVEKHKFGQGLGYTKKGNEEVSFTARAEQIIQDYAKSKSSSDLIFSTEFSKEERKEIHRIAAKYNLKNNSKGGKGDGRHIIISRRYTAQQLLNCLRKAGGRTHKYELLPPTG